MRPIRDEPVCLATPNDFVARRVSAAVFVPRFQGLWHCDRPGGIDGLQPASEKRENAPGLYGLLDSVDRLCGTYAHDLPAGCGYRVSEEQFRKEIESMTSGLHLPGVHEA